MNEQALTTRFMGGLSYLSIMFLPVLFPLIVWIIARSDNPNLASHARMAFWTQLVPLIMVLVLLLGYGILGAANMISLNASSSWFVVLWITLLCLVSLVLYIYNIAMAVLVFLGRR